MEWINRTRAIKIILIVIAVLLGVVIGVGSIWVLLSVFLSPLALLLMYRLMLSLSVSLSEIIGAKLSERCFSSFRFSLDTLISVHSLSLIIYVFQIILFVKSGVSIL